MGQNIAKYDKFGVISESVRYIADTNVYKAYRHLSTSLQPEGLAVRDRHNMIQPSNEQRHISCLDHHNTAGASSEYDACSLLTPSSNAAGNMGSL